MHYIDLEFRSVVQIRLFDTDPDRYGSIEPSRHVKKSRLDLMEFKPFTTCELHVNPERNLHSAPSLKTYTWRRRLVSWFFTISVCYAFLMVSGRLRAPDLQGEAPDFTLVALDESRYTLRSLRGRPVVLNFWATWCGPCRFELPMLQRWASAHPEVMTLGIAVDRDRAAVRRFFTDQRSTYPILWDHARVQDAYKVTTLPTTIVLNAEGKIVGAHTGILFGPELDLLLL